MQKRIGYKTEITKAAREGGVHKTVNPPYGQNHTEDYCDVKPLARRVVQKKAIAEDEEIKTPFAIIKKRSANCI